MAEKIRVVMCPADRPPYITNITNSLSAMQSAVGGYIETVTVDKYVLVCNEEGRIRGLPKNPSAPHYYGDLFIVSHEGDEFTGLEPEDARDMLHLFKETYGESNNTLAISG